MEKHDLTVCWHNALPRPRYARRSGGKENNSEIDEVTKKMIMSRFDDESYAVGSSSSNNNNNKKSSKAKKEQKRSNKKDKADSGVRFRDGVVVSNKGGKFITEEVSRRGGEGRATVLTVLVLTLTVLEY